MDKCVLKTIERSFFNDGPSQSRIFESGGLLVSVMAAAPSALQVCRSADVQDAIAV
ncbi:MAG: hypothetical protein AAFN12_02625 [Cyanobacteria bacterium J06560_2]